MKKRLISSIILLITFATSSYSQEISSSLNSPKLNGRSVNKIPYTSGILPDIITSTAYCVDSLHLKSIPLPSGVPLTTIGNLQNACSSGVFINGLFYVYRPGNSIGTINVSNLSETLLGTITGIPSGYVLTSMAYKQPNGPMYIGATNITASYLYTLNLSTLAATLVGYITNCPGLMAFSMNCSGELYGIDIVNDNLVRINPLTGAGTIIGPLGFNANYQVLAAYDLPTNILYWITSTGTNQQLRANGVVITTYPGTGITAFAVPGSCTPVLACDMQAGPFVSLPTAFQMGNNYIIKAKITNVGTAAQANIPVKFFVNGVQNGATQTIPSLAPGAFDTNTIFVWTPNWNGNKILKICTALACDSNRTNDTATTFVTVGSEPPIFCDYFSSGTGNWTITNNGGTCVWIAETPRPGMTLPPSAYGICFAADADFCGSGTSINSTATLANAIDCTGHMVYIEFDNDFFVLGSDQAKFDVSTDGGSTWINKFTWTTSHRYTHESFMLPEAANKPNVKIRFTAIEPGWDKWWAIDNVCVRPWYDGVSSSGNDIPDKYALSQNYPNPFNPTTVISYALPKSGIVKLVVFDVLGREVYTLVNEYKHAGSYEVTFDGSSLSSGLYFYRMTSGTFTDVKKMLMIK